MRAGFQCWVDVFGDLLVADGVVTQPKTGTRIAVGSGTGFTALGLDRRGSDYTAAPPALGGTFVGGSGRNLISDGVVTGLSTGAKPTGFFRPYGVGVWRAGAFVLTVLGASSATISDGVDVVAELTTGGTAPVGDFDSTTYGETTYNAAAAFTLAVTAEGGSVGIPAAVVYLTAGTAQDGSFTATDEVTWTSATDADWTIVIDAADGTAELLNLTDVVATRAAGSKTDPSGTYEATALGMATYNLTDDEPVDGEPWRATVNLVGKAPRVGYVYLEIIEASGVLDQVNGPFFAATLPAPATDTYYLQLAYSDGTAIEQDHIGAVVWP